MDPFSILLFIVLFILSGFFSGSEIAFMSIPHHKIQSLIKQKLPGARELKKLRDDTEKLLITILIGNNLVNTFTASLAAKISIDIAKSSWLEQSLAIWISTGIITLLILIFGEITPKTFATRNAERLALSISKFFIVLQYILYPAVIAIELITKLFKGKNPTRTYISDEEIVSFIEMGEQSWVFEKGEYEKIKSMLNFHDVTAQEVMTPRMSIEALSDAITVDEAIKEVLNFSHSRIPVYHESIDTVKHIISLRELMYLQQLGKWEEKLTNVCSNDIIKVPISKPIHKILENFRNSRQHIAIVIDEYGSMAGIITLEDIVEEVFGDIQDETDVEKESIVQKDNYWIAQPYMMFDDLLECVWLDFDAIQVSDEAYIGETLSYFIIDYLERFPKANEVISLPLVFHVEDYEKTKNTAKHLNIQILDVSDDAIQECKVWFDKD